MNEKWYIFALKSWYIVGLKKAASCTCNCTTSGSPLANDRSTTGNADEW